MPAGNGTSANKFRTRTPAVSSMAIVTWESPASEKVILPASETDPSPRPAGLVVGADAPLLRETASPAMQMSATIKQILTDFIVLSPPTNRCGDERHGEDVPNLIQKSRNPFSSPSDSSLHYLMEGIFAARGDFWKWIVRHSSPDRLSCFDARRNPNILCLRVIRAGWIFTQ
jgi:hypothetical protein